MSEEPKEIKVFIAYSDAQEDVDLKVELEKHLALLEKSNVIQPWDQGQVYAGEEVEEETFQHLNSADIVLLLLSADFFFSPSCDKIREIALKRHSNPEDSAYIIPVMLRKVNWAYSSLTKLKPIPSATHPIKSSHWFSIDDAFFKVVEEVEKVAKLLRKPKEAAAQSSYEQDGDVVVADPGIRDYKNAVEIANVKSDRGVSDAGGLTSAADHMPKENQKKAIDEYLEATSNASKVKIADVEFSRAELLLKKAILLHDEAVMEDDEAQKRNKLEKAIRLLHQASRLEPSNVEVLLEMAKVLIILTPDDPTDEEQVLMQIRRMIDNPRDDKEAFVLAQTKYLLATPDFEHINIKMVKEARKTFKKLGHMEWVEDCDEIIKQSERYKSPPPPPVNAPNAPAHQNINQPVMPPPPAPFNPVGQWLIEIHAMIKNSMTINFFPNGSLTGSQKLVFNIPFSGQWSFANNVLYIQGYIAGSPVAFNIQILYEQNGLYHGRGNDGINYVFRRIG